MKGRWAAGVVALVLVGSQAGGQTTIDIAYWNQAVGSTPEGTAPKLAPKWLMAAGGLTAISADEGQNGSAASPLLWYWPCGTFIGNNTINASILYQPLLDDRNPAYPVNTAPLNSTSTFTLPNSGCVGDPAKLLVYAHGGAGWGSGETLLPNAGEGSVQHPRFIGEFDRKFNGKYAMWVYLVNGGTTYHYGRIVWRVNGQWALTRPPALNSMPYHAPDTTGGTSTTGDVEVIVKNFNQAVNAVSVQIGGAGTGTGTTNAAGVCTLTGLAPGACWVKVGPGTFPDVPGAGNASGGTFAAVYRGITVVTEKKKSLIVDLMGGSSGSAIWSGGEDWHTTTPATGSGSGTPAEGWLEGILQAMFVPSSETIDSLKGTMSTFWNWGPFSVVQSMAGIETAPPMSVGLMNLPIPIFNILDGQLTGVSSNNHVQITDPGFAAAPAFTWLRNAMGIGVYLMFIGALYRYLMPRQVV